MSPYNLDKGQHSVYSLYYHFIQVVKYRKKVFLREISETFNVDVLDIEDHFHMLFKATPLLNITKYVNAIKTITSREIQRNFPDVKNELYNNEFWAPSYFLATSGQVTLDVLKKYVDSQEAKRHEGL